MLQKIGINLKTAHAYCIRRQGVIFIKTSGKSAAQNQSNSEFTLSL